MSAVAENNSDATNVADDSEIPDWNSMSAAQIYDALNTNPKAKPVWRSRVVDRHGKQSFLFRAIVNRLFKALVNDGYLPESEESMAQKVCHRQKQKNIFSKLDGPALTVIRNFLNYEFRPAVNADGDTIDAGSVVPNLAARCLFLAHDPESFDALSEIFSGDTCRAKVDDPSMSFDMQWSYIAETFFNADSWRPENNWATMDSRCESIDPRLPPASPWTGDQIRKCFREYRFLITKCDDFFRRSGNVEGGLSIDLADRFEKHVNEASTDLGVRSVLMFAFWMFKGRFPRFCTRSKPDNLQFDTSYQTPACSPSNVASTLSNESSKKRNQREEDGEFKKKQTLFMDRNIASMTQSDLLINLEIKKLEGDLAKDAEFKEVRNKKEVDEAELVQITLMKAKQEVEQGRLVILNSRYDTYQKLLAEKNLEAAKRETLKKLTAEVFEEICTLR